MINKWVLYIFSICIFSSTNLVFAYQVNEKEWHEIKEVSEEILKRCPPDDCVVVGIGRSPTPFTTYLRVNGYEAYNFPLSNFRYGEEQNLELLSNFEEQTLFQHFDHFLPNPERLQNRSILFIDHTISGESISASKRYLDKYFKTLNRHQHVMYFACTQPGGVEDLSPHFPGIEFYDLLEDGKLDDYLADSRYDNYSEFGSFDLKKMPQYEKQVTQYGEFFEAMRKAKKNYSHSGSRKRRNNEETKEKCNG